MRAPAARVGLESRLLKAKNRACRLQHCPVRPISAQVYTNMLTDRAENHHIMIMMHHRSYKPVAAVFFAYFSAISAVPAGDQGKSIVNSLDPKSMNELFDALPQQPDA